MNSAQGREKSPFHKSRAARSLAVLATATALLAGPLIGAAPAFALSGTYGTSVDGYNDGYWTDDFLELEMVAGTSYSAGLMGPDDQPYTYYLLNGVFPTGLELSNSSDGYGMTLSGTPTEAGSFTFVIEGTDNAEEVYIARSFTVTVQPGEGGGPGGGTPTTPTLTAPVWVDNAIGTLREGVYVYDSFISATAEIESYTLAEGSVLPDGLYLNSETGEITGVPETEGEYSFDVIATNAGGQTRTTVSGTIASSDPSWEDYSLGDLAEGYWSTSNLWAIGAESYELAPGSTLPAGLELGDCRLSRASYCYAKISGTPEVEGPYSFDLIATNRYGSTTITVSGSVAASNPVWEETDLGDLRLVLGVEYDNAVTAIDPLDGVGEHQLLSYKVTAGALPQGLELNTETGAITGTPEVEGQFAFTIVASNGYGSVSADYTGEVRGAFADLTLEAAKGDTAGDADVFASAKGLLVGSDYDVTVHSTPISIASGKVPVGGSLALGLKLPAGLEDGAHRIVLTGTTAAGKAVTSEVWFSVLNGKIVQVSYDGPVADPRGALAYTGSGSSTGIQLMLVLGLIGTGSLLLLGRRRPLNDLGL